MLRTVKHVHDSEFSMIGDLKTWSPMDNPGENKLDPFILLNHHGPQVYPRNNNGMPFGPHPHRGMETITFIMQGDVLHLDSNGHKSVIGSGGVQYMTAGKGLLHAEVNSDAYKEKGGDIEVLQLWLNLPARLKMTEPFYVGKQEDEIPVAEQEGTRIQIHSGEWNGTKGAFDTITDIHIATLHLHQGAEVSTSIPKERNIFFYVLNGEVEVNGSTASGRQLVEFDFEGEELRIKAIEDSRVIVGHGKPFGEPVVAHGPFVMNTTQEIYQAFEDYQAGKFGLWPE